MDAHSRNRAEFAITEAHVIAATGAAMKRHFTRMPYVAILFGAYSLAVVLLALLMNFEDLAALLIAALLAPPIAYLLIMKVAVPWQAKRHFKQVALLSEEAFAEWDGGGITLGGTRGHARLAWSDFYAWDRIPEVVMLYQGEALFNMLPVDAIGENAAVEIEGHLKASGVKRR